MGHEAQPGFLDEVLGALATPGQAGEEGEEPRVERAIHNVECRAVSGAEPQDQCEFGLAVHAAITRTDAICDGRHASAVRAF